MSSLSNFMSVSLGVDVRIERVGIAELLELFKSFGHRLPFTLTDLHVLDEGIKFNLIVDQGNLLGCVLILDGVEI